VNKETWVADLKDFRRAITSNTILIVGSAPSFPHGLIDDIVGLAHLASQHHIGLHVDCCLGGFLLPFMKDAGYLLPGFDFSVEGVTSISCDTHKYGFAPKGSSVILYSNKNLRQYQYFVSPNWMGGIYASATLAGSRPGSLLAGCWATMLSMGRNGYIETTKAIISTSRKLSDGISKIPGLYILGNPQVSVIAFNSKQFDILRMTTALSKKGWGLNTLQFPSCIHICVTYLTEKVVDKLLADLREIADELSKQPNSKTEGLGAMYGLTQSIPDRSLVEQIGSSYLDMLYKTFQD